MKEAKRGCRPSSGGHLDLPLAAQMKLQPWARPLASPRRRPPAIGCSVSVACMRSLVPGFSVVASAAENISPRKAPKRGDTQPGGASEDNLHAKWCTKLPYEATQLSHRVGPYDVTLYLAS